MRKSLSFLVVSILIYILTLGILVLFHIHSPYTISGIIAIISGFIFLLFPLEVIQFFGFFPKLPIFFSLLTVWITMGISLITICALELILPIAAGYVLINSCNLPSFSYMIGVMVYIAIWIALRKKYIMLISNSWKKGVNIIENTVKPLFEVINEFDTIIHKVYEWVRKHK